MRNCYVLKLVKEMSKTEIDIALHTCVEVIKEECKNADISKTEYKTSIDRCTSDETDCI